MRSILWFLLYVPLQLLGLPLAVAGGVMAMYAQFAAHRRRGSSFTAGKAIQPRWFLHYWGVRPDPITAAFLKRFPATSEAGLWMVFAPAWLASKLSGHCPSLMSVPARGRETLLNFLNSRTVRFDSILTAALPKVTQVVNLGGGFDLRLLQFTRTCPHVFEVDQAATQRFKLDVMRKAGLAHDWVTYVPVDFREQSWTQQLLATGFNKSRVTYFHWESVSLYLDEETVKSTLAKISALCAEGSVIAQDFYCHSFMGEHVAKFVERIGEPFKFTVDMSQGVEEFKNWVATFLHGFGFKLTECYPMGGDTKTGLFYAIVVAQKVPLS